MKNGTIQKIYVELIDGTAVLVPCSAAPLDNDKYKIIETEELDLNEDATSIWAFFPGDIVKCKKKGKMLVAHELIESDFPNRKMHQLIFNLVKNFGELGSDDLEIFQDEIKLLRSSNCEIKQRQHPIIEKWLHQYFT